eukprot:376840_1
MSISSDVKLEEEFKSLIDCFPDTYYCQGISSLPQLLIPEISNDCIKYPINETILSQIKSLCTPSKFGFKTQTIYNKSIRNSIELTSNQFHLYNFPLDSKASPMLEHIRKELMHHIDYIIAKPYKLIIYEKNCFFNKHKDSRSSPLHFGSLILLLPFDKQYENGNFILSKNKHSQYIWKLNKELHGKDMCQYLAFYTDSDHQVKTVTNGVRISIIFQLFINETFFNDFNKYNSIALNNLYYDLKDKKQSKKKYKQIKTNKSGLQKIKSIRGLNLNPKAKYVMNIKLYNALVELKLFTDDICKIICQFLCHNILDRIETLIREYYNNIENYKLKHVSFGEYQGSMNPYFIIMFEHKYSGKIIHPLMLKGRDIYVYKYFQKYMFVYALAMEIYEQIGRQSYMQDDNGVRNDDETWEVKEIFDENHKRKTKCIELGNKYVNQPEFMYYIESFDKAFVLYINDDQLEYIGNKDIHNWIGNVGTYGLYDSYHCSGLVMSAFFPNKSTTLLTEEYCSESQNI